MERLGINAWRKAICDGEGEKEDAGGLMGWVWVRVGWKKRGFRFEEKSRGEDGSQKFLREDLDWIFHQILRV